MWSKEYILYTWRITLLYIYIIPHITSCLRIHRLLNECPPSKLLYLSYLLSVLINVVKVTDENGANIKVEYMCGSSFKLRIVVAFFELQCGVSSSAKRTLPRMCITAPELAVCVCVAINTICVELNLKTKLVQKPSKHYLDRIYIYTYKRGSALEWTPTKRTMASGGYNRFMACFSKLPC